METKGNKPSLGWAILSLVFPVAMILYGTLVVGVRPPVLPLIGAVALAGLMGLKTGYRWEELQEGMFEALGRIQIAIAILALVGMIIAAWLASGTIPAIIYWGLKLIAPEHFLLSAMVLCSVASIATGTSFGTMGTIGVALLGVGQALGYPPAMTVGAIVSGAYIGIRLDQHYCVRLRSAAFRSYPVHALDDGPGVRRGGDRVYRAWFLLRAGTDRFAGKPQRDPQRP